MARLLIVVNKAAQSKTIDLPVDDTALAGCTGFQPKRPRPELRRQ